MRGQIGNWGDCLDVGFTPEMVAWLDEFGVDRRVSLGVMTVEQWREDGTPLMSRSLSLFPDAEGVKVFQANDTMALSHHVRFCVKTHPDLARLKAPRFRLHEVTFGPTLFSDAVACAVDHDHLLPWPKLTDCEMYDVAEVLERDLALRLRSALIHGGKSFGAPMPDKLRDRMAPGTYKAALASARATLEAEKAAAMEAALAA